MFKEIDGQSASLSADAAKEIKSALASKAQEIETSVEPRIHEDGEGG